MHCDTFLYVYRAKQKFNGKSVPRKSLEIFKILFKNNILSHIRIIFLCHRIMQLLLSPRSNYIHLEIIQQMIYYLLEMKFWLVVDLEHPSHFLAKHTPHIM